MDTEVVVNFKKCISNKEDELEKKTCFVKKEKKKTLKKQKKKQKTKRKKIKKLPMFEKKKMLKKSGIFKETDTMPDDLVDVVFEAVV
jgi:hypothetical protein